MAAPFEHQPVETADGGRSVMAWNLQLWANGVDAKRPCRVEITWDIQGPTPGGMPEAQEEARLTDMAARLEGAMKRKASAKYALRLTGDGKQTHVFYTPARVGVVGRKDVSEAVRKMLAGFGDARARNPTFVVADDPEWTRILGIFESHDPEQWQADRALLVHMAKQRDAIMARRPVHHRATFQDRDQCRAFLQGARKLRFKSEGGPKQVGGAWVGSVVRKEPTLATYHLHAVVLKLKALVAQGEGVYDGWETEVVKRLDPEPLTAGKK